MDFSIDFFLGKLIIGMTRKAFDFSILVLHMNILLSVYQHSEFSGRVFEGLMLGSTSLVK